MPPKPMDIAGQRFGKLVAVARVGSSSGGAVWLCRCDCGDETKCSAGGLRRRDKASCGCVRRLASERLISESPEHRIWCTIANRCTNPNNTSFARYGERGIVVCLRWRESFAAFFEDMGPRPSSLHSVDRKENDRGYSCGKCTDCIARGEPANCRWATPHEQNRNKRTNRWIDVGGERLTITDASQRFGLSRSSITRRLDAGWDPLRAVTLQAHPHRKAG